MLIQYNETGYGVWKTGGRKACDILLRPSPSGPDAALPSRGQSILFQTFGACEMTMTMRTLVVCVVSAIACVIGTATPADAQYGRRTVGDPAVGETYHIEGALTFWRPDPALEIASESLGIPGTTIDAVADLGFESSTFTDFKLVLRPSRKFKFRLGYTPIKYEAQAQLTRDIIFNGQRYRVGVPVNSEMTWKAWRFGLEYDFVYRDRGFVGLVLEAKYTDVEARLTNSRDEEFVRAHAPIPAIGLIGRGYVLPNVSITGEFTFFKVPDIDEDYGGSFYDLDIYGTVNFTPNFGAQVGYRSFDVSHLAERDNGDLRLRGMYLGGTVRF
jgi:hypothetical protein